MNALHLLWIIPLTFILGYIACALLCANGDADKKTERNAPYWATEQAFKNGYQKGYEDGKRDAVKHGRWLKDGDFLICLNCESEINVKNSLGIENHKNFCPNCGADMRG
jgi:hypothetical protein